MSRSLSARRHSSDSRRARCIFSTSKCLRPTAGLLGGATTKLHSFAFTHSLSTSSETTHYTRYKLPSTGDRDQTDLVLTLTVDPDPWPRLSIPGQLYRDPYNSFAFTHSLSTTSETTYWKGLFTVHELNWTQLEFANWSLQTRSPALQLQCFILQWQRVNDHWQHGKTDAGKF